jgi:hypothetical protein
LALAIIILRSIGDLTPFFFERKPDIYLKVLDKTGKTLYSSRKAVCSEAGREEKVDITIKMKADEIKR